MDFGPRKSNQEVFAEYLKPQGARLLDVGCGAGRLSRLLTEMGARVSGIDPGAAQLQRARMVEPAGDETYVEGIAQDLPFDNASFDIVVFFNSLHHIPAPGMAAGLAEANRVLRRGGILFIAEPVAAGPFHEMQKPFHDETEVRALALEAARRHGETDYTNPRHITYLGGAKFESFVSFRAGQIAIDAERGGLDKTQVAELRERFEHFGLRRDDGIYFDQPMQAIIMEKE